MNPSILPIFNVISTIVLLCLMLVAFLGIMSFAIYQLKHSSANKTKKRKRKGDGLEVIDLYKQFEYMIVVQCHTVRLMFPSKKRKKYSLSAKIKAKLKSLELSGMLSKPHGNAGLLAAAMIFLAQAYSIYLAASMQLNNLFVVGWGTLTVWLILSAWISDLPTGNKFVLSIFSPLAYFLLFIRLGITILFAPAKKKTYI